MSNKTSPRNDEVSIFVEQSFDYAHFLPESDKCFPLHGHTSLVTLEIRGSLGPSDMVMDFGEAKRILGSILSLLDHKLLTNKRYSALQKDGRVLIHYKDFEFRLPQDQVFLLDGEGTSEDIALSILSMVMAEMPENISFIRITTTEGLRKGTIVERVIAR
jgi:6-pyruvoyl-tetrahydropterin synthase